MFWTPRKLIVVGAIFVSILVIIAIWTPISHLNTGKLSLTVVPNDSTVKIDSKQTVSPGDIYLSPGSHLLVISRSGFASQTIKVNIVKNKTVTQELVLIATNTEGLDWIKNHPDQAGQAEGITGKQNTEAGQTIQAQNKIIAILPEIRRDFTVSFGKSQKNLDDPNSVGIYIKFATPEGKQLALDWIVSQGYDPATLEIIYVDVNQDTY